LFFAARQHEALFFAKSISLSSQGDAHAARAAQRPMGDDEGRPTLHAWLLSLAEAHDVRVHPSLEFRETEHSGRGLFASRDVPIGDTLLSVPRALSLSVQDGAGVSLPPDGAWPRVRAGVAAASPDAGKSWECVLARAVVDAVAGDGGAFWARYGGMMPPPESLALPFLIPDGELNSLEDAGLAEDALVERARIAALMPDLLDPVSEEGEEEAPGASPSGEDDEKKQHPDVARSVAAWALALVRSRVLLAGEVRGAGPPLAARAIVPFIDLANHAEGGAPNADYRCEGVETPGAPPPRREDSTRFELVAIKSIAAREEIALAYTKGEGTSRAHFAQYGFAPVGGYAGDRVELLAADAERASDEAENDAAERKNRPAVEGKTATRLRASLRAKLRGALQRSTAENTSSASWVAAGTFLSGLFGTEGEPMSEREETMTLVAIRTRVAETERAWRTSLEADEAEAAEIGARVAERRRSRSGAASKAELLEERRLCVLGLRTQKKRLVRRVAELLEDADLQVASA
jgi:hypothetical protein